MNYTQILQELYRRTGYSTTPAVEITARLSSFVAITQRQILTAKGLEKLRDDTITFASVANQAVYALPPAVAKIQHIQDRLNFRHLAEMSLTWLRTVDPGLMSVGGPSDVYVPRGYQPVSVQPSNASEIFVKSTAAGDVFMAYLEGIRTGGYPVSLSKQMTGVTAVSLGSTFTDILEVTKFYLSQAAIGTVTLLEDSGVGTELARIPIGQTFGRYLAIQLWPTPTSAITYHVDYTRVIPDFVNGTDEPLVPEDFHWLLVEGALIKEWGKKDDTRTRDARADFRTGVNDLRAWVNSNQDTTASLRRVPRAYSQLGPSYPSGS